MSTNRVVKNQQMCIIRGDAYTDALGSRHTVESNGFFWPDLSAPTTSINFKVRPNPLHPQVSTALPGFEIAGIIITPTGNNKKIGVDLQSDETVLLTPLGRDAYVYEYTALFATGDAVTLATGKMHVEGDLEP